MSDVLGLIVERIHIRLVLEALESLYFSVGYKNFVSKLKSMSFCKIMVSWFL